MPTADNPPRCGTWLRLKPTGQPNAGSGIRPKWPRSGLGNKSGYVRMKARNTVSGTTSVLIEPWRKKSRSARDQVGTWADSVPAAFPADGWEGGLFVDVVQEIQIQETRESQPDHNDPSELHTRDYFTRTRSSLARLFAV